MDNNKIMPTLFHGCATALVTPMRSGAVDFPALRRLINHQVESGISALVVCGTTGEAPTLSGDEKRRIVSVAVSEADGKIPVIAGCGSPSTSFAAHLGAELESEGADGLLCVTPYYNKATELGVYMHYKTICEAVSIPVIAYNVPSRTGMSLTLSALEMLSEIPNLCGVKEASGNMTETAKTVSALGDRYTVYSGCDELIAPTYAVGGKGIISVASNIIPSEIVKLCELCENGKLSDAAEYQLSLMPLISSLFSEINPIPVKTALCAMGFCTPEMRLPLCRMNGKKEGTLRHLMHEFDLI